MLKAILPILLTLALVVAGCQPLSEPSDETSPTAPVKGIHVGDLAPDFQLQNLDGQVISLSGLRGKPVLINFWATWCPPCVYEMPYMQQIHEEWSATGLVVLAVDIGESPSTVENFMQNNNLSLPVLLDTKQDVATSYGIRSIPTTFFIDKNGIIQDKKIGAFQNKAEIEKHLSKIIP